MIVEQEMHFEDILAEVGDYGYYQKRIVYLFLIPSATLLPLFCMTTIFMVSSPDHWCKVSQLSNYTYEQQKQLSSPLIEKNGFITHDSCHMYDIDYDYVAKVGNITIYKNDNNINGSLRIKSCNNGWIYDNFYYDETAVTAVRFLLYLNLIIKFSPKLNCFRQTIIYYLFLTIIYFLYYPFSITIIRFYDQKHMNSNVK